MQALGSYEGGRLLFLGLGTGLGSAMIVDGVVEPLELAHMPYGKATFEDYVGERGLKRLGKKRWRKRVEDVVETLIKATEPTDVVIGGGNVKKLKELPPARRAGSNDNAFTGGFRLWTGDKSIGGLAPTQGAAAGPKRRSPGEPTSRPTPAEGNHAATTRARTDQFVPGVTGRLPAHSLPTDRDGTGRTRLGFDLGLDSLFFDGALRCNSG